MKLRSVYALHLVSKNRNSFESVGQADEENQMSFTPEQSKIRVTPSLEEQIASASSQSEISAILRHAAVAQGAARPDAYDPNVLHPTNAPVPQKYAQTITLPTTGEKFIVEGDTELEVQQKVNQLLRAAMTESPAQQAQEMEQPRDADGRFVSAEDAAARTELELQFKRGEITTETYLRESGALDSYLAENGIDPEALREVSSKKFEQSWADATNEFLSSAAGADWPGGETNRQTIGQIIAETGWIESANKAEALTAAWAYMKQHPELIASNPETDAQNALAKAKSPAEIQEALNAYRPAGSSGMFGR